MGNIDFDIVILTGAGISKESGLDTFRDDGGIWSSVKIEEVASQSAYRKNPKKVQEFYNSRRRQLIDGNIKPNIAHHALVKLEKKWTHEGRGRVTIVTQNIDNLHEIAGSKNLVHMHGEILKARCQKCGSTLICDYDLGFGEACFECSGINSLRPHVVWFGEEPLEMERVYALLQGCALFISVGTSGHVYPAAGFIRIIKKHFLNIYTVELNLEPSAGATLFDEVRYGAATDIIPEFVEELLFNGVPSKDTNRN
jgi:NAD-dependent deacetylase